MTFKHKLSRRLALLRDVVLLGGLVTLTGCDLRKLMGLLEGVVVTVSVDPAAPSIMAGRTVQLTATPRDGSGNALTGRVVSWSTDNAAVATVNASGLVTGAAAGAATVTAMSESMIGSAAVTVAPANAAVASVTVSPATASVTAGQTAQLTATPQDASGTALTGRVVTWGSSNTAIATVNGSGLVTAVAAGPATITATSEGQSGSAALTVTTVPVASVVVSPATASRQVGQTVQLTATPQDASGTALTGRVVTWGSSNTAVATVNGSGLVTGMAAGPATITATSEGQSGSAAITVTAAATNPGAVTDLAVPGVTDSSVTLAFTEVTDGTGAPASYDVRWAAGTIAWASATDVARGSCATPMSGSAIGARRSCTVLGLAAGVGYQFQVVAFRGTLNVNAVFGGLSNVASGTTTASTAPVATVTVSPASANVVVGTLQQFTATLRDAAGNVLTGRTVTWTSSALGVATVNATGLVSGLVVGTSTITATSEGRSGTASVAVTATPPGGVVFQSDWSTVGTAYADVTDGGRWMNYWEFNNGDPIQLISVVSGASVNAPGGRNALKVVQRGSVPGYAANIQQDRVVPPSTDFYVRFYMRNDDTSPAGDHIVTVDTYQYANLTYVRKTASATTWQLTSSFYGCGYTYPIGHWTLAQPLVNGAWYRFEYFVHFVDATHVQVHPRIYDAAGVQIGGDADFQQSNYKMSGNLSFGGRDDWTLALFYAAGYSFCVNPTYVTSFGMGNNGQNGSVDTGLAWYFAGVEIRTDRWPGP